VLLVDQLPFLVRLSGLGGGVTGTSRPWSERKISPRLLVSEARPFLCHFAHILLIFCDLLLIFSFKKASFLADLPAFWAAAA
jgi:hypothetical protein